MLTIWKNFFTGRNKWALSGLCFMSLMSIGIASTYHPMPEILPWWFWGVFAIFGYVFVLPSAIYLIDRNAQQNPRPKTNLGRTLTGR